MAGLALTFQNGSNFDYILSYRLNTLLNVGLGISWEDHLEVMTLPLLLDTRGDLFKTRITPYYQANAGWILLTRSASSTDRHETGG